MKLNSKKIILFVSAIIFYINFTHTTSDAETSNIKTLNQRANSHQFQRQETYNDFSTIRDSQTINQQLAQKKLHQEPTSQSLSSEFINPKITSYNVDISNESDREKQSTEKKRSLKPKPKLKTLSPEPSKSKSKPQPIFSESIDQELNIFKDFTLKHPKLDEFDTPISLHDTNATQHNNKDVKKGSNPWKEGGLKKKYRHNLDTTNKSDRDQQATEKKGSLKPKPKPKTLSPEPTKSKSKSKPQPIFSESIDRELNTFKDFMLKHPKLDEFDTPISLHDTNATQHNNKDVKKGSKPWKKRGLKRNRAQKKPTSNNQKTLKT